MKFINFNNCLINLFHVTHIYLSYDEESVFKIKMAFDDGGRIAEEFTSEEELFDRMEEIKKSIFHNPFYNKNKNNFNQ